MYTRRFVNYEKNVTLWAIKVYFCDILKNIFSQRVYVTIYVRRFILIFVFISSFCRIGPLLSLFYFIFYFFLSLYIIWFFRLIGFLNFNLYIIQQLIMLFLIFNIQIIKSQLQKMVWFT